MIRTISDESALRVHMEEHFRRRIDDVVWKQLVAEGSAEGALLQASNSDPIWFEDFKDAVRSQEAIAHAYRAPEGSSHARTRSEAGVPDDSRLRAWKQVTALDASRQDYVIGFRRRVLRGKLIKPTRVAVWIKKKAAIQGDATIHAKVQLDSDGIPIVPKGGVKNWFKETLAYRDPKSDWVCHQELNSHSALGDLKQVATRLQQTYGWSEANSVEFVLSGVVPVGMMRRYSWQRNFGPQLSRVVIDVTADTPDQVVRQMYSAARKQLPKTGRAMKKVHADLAAFIAEVNDGRTWREALVEYNSRFSPKKYGDNIRRFQRDASDAFSRVVNLKLRWEGRARGPRPSRPGENRNLRIKP